MSIRARLLLATAVVVVVALVGANVATYTALRSYLYGQIDTSLEVSHRPIEAALSQSLNGPSQPGPTHPTGQTPGSDEGQEGPGPMAGPPECPEKFHGREVDATGLSPGTVIEVRNAAGSTVWRCSLAVLGSRDDGRPVLPTHITGFVADAADDREPTVYFTAASSTGGSGYRVRASILGTGPEAGGQLIVAVPLTSTSDVLGDLLLIEIFATVGAILIAVALGWWLVRASLHPLREIGRTADMIAAGQLSERVPGDEARTEVGHVARAFNVMLERIERAFAARDKTEADLRTSEEHMRRFVADASHELRTPLTAVRAYAELFDRGAAERPEDLRRAMRGIQDESARMSHLVEDLLLLARLDEGRPLRLEHVDLVALTAEAVSTARTVGPEWPLILSATEPVEVLGDELRLRQVLDNLLANVRVHTPPGTTAVVRVEKSDTEAVVSVTDDGPGLTEDDRRRIFERFFRTDTSRSRDHGGAGLGLSIVDAIVRAHGGSVTVLAPSAGGAEFTVRLPATDVERAEPIGHDASDD